MKTLYDLLGALPDDDAEDLRAAFRRAVKANHPDLNPGDPEASQAFRRIVRANAILSDGGSGRPMIGCSKSRAGSKFRNQSTADSPTGAAGSALTQW